MGEDEERGGVRREERGVRNESCQQTIFAFFPAIPAFHPAILAFYPPFPLSTPVIPAKAGIQRGRGACEPSYLSEIKYESRATNPFPLYGLTGVGFDSRHSRESGNPEGTRGLRTKTAAQNQAQIAVNKSLPPLWGKARMGVRRAQARLCGRDARAPETQTYPCKPFTGEG